MGLLFMTIDHSMKRAAGFLLMVVVLVNSQNATESGVIEELRLTGGNDLHEGNIEVKVGGVWGFVCDDDFGFPEADVVCRDLGYDGAAKFTKNNHFGTDSPEWRKSSVKYWFSHVNCSNVESGFEDCSTDGLGIHDCGTTEIAGVVCWIKEVSPCALGDYPCEDAITCISRSAVCDEVTDCPDKSDEAEELCNDVGVTRLISLIQTNIPGAAIGTVQVKLNGEWGTVCDEYLSSGKEAKVICRSLGYTEGWILGFPRSYFGEVSGRSLVYYPLCNGTEQWLGECLAKSWGRDKNRCYDIGQDYGVFCYDGDLQIRLTGGNSPKTGRVEVQMSGTWGGICGTGFDLFDAQVICRMLGYDGDASAYREEEESGEGGEVWQMILNCGGNEDRIEECSLRFPESPCSKQIRAGVICSHSPSQIDAELKAALGNTECGVPEDAAEEFLISFAKIRGGRRRSVFDTPWLVGLRILSIGVLDCGGVIISEDFILTAGHCFDLRGPLNYIVRVGDYNSNVNEEYEQEFRIEDFWVHEHKNEQALGDNDIALIKIKRKYGRGIRFGPRVKPICLPKAGASYDNLTQCTVAGWGPPVFQARPAIRPRVGRQEVIDDYACETTLLNGPHDYTSSMICSGVVSPTFINACHGDSGGPLTCEFGRKRTLFGLVSSGPPCEDRPFYDIYVRVTLFLRWILEKIRSAEKN